MVAVLNLIIFIASFFILWIGSGLIVKNVSKFSHLLKISSFSISFFLLGFLTSIPELTVGINAIIDQKPEIFVGNLIGGIIIIFSLIFPLLAIISGKIKLVHDLENKNLILVLLYLLLPLAFLSDQIINLIEAIFLIIYYLIIFYLLERKQTFLEKITAEFTNHQRLFIKDILKIIFGLVLVIFSSHFIVENTLYFSSLLKISPFFVALIIISIGTNLPELSLVIRSIKEKKQTIAFGDYLGSAAANVFLLGLLTVVNENQILLPNHFYQYSIFIFLSLTLFYFFTKSEKILTAKEGLILLFIYFFYLIFELTRSF